MAIKIRLHTQQNDKSKVYSDPSDNPSFEGPTLEINVKKNIRGDYMIMDHTDINIVYSQQNHNVLAMPKNANVSVDLVYDAQNRFFQFLVDKGIVDPESIQGASLYGAMEADIFENTNSEVQENQAVLFSIGRFIEQERPFFQWKDAFRDKMVNNLTNPGDENSTDLSTAISTHSQKKGSIDGKWLSNVAYSIYEQHLRRLVVKEDNEND